MAELQMIDIVHPSRPDEVATVPASSLPHHQRAGWHLAEPPDLRAKALQILVDGGIDPDEADKLLAPAEQADPADGQGDAPDADPKSSRASASEDTAAAKPKRRPKSTEE